MHKLLLVQADPVAGQEAEYLDWYRTKHLGDHVSIPSVESGRLYRQFSALDGTSGHSYVVAYEVSNPVEMMERLTERRRNPQHEARSSNAIDRANATMSVVAPLAGALRLPQQVSDDGPDPGIAILHLPVAEAQQPGFASEYARHFLPTLLGAAGVGSGAVFGLDSFQYNSSPKPSHFVLLALRDTARAAESLANLALVPAELRGAPAYRALAYRAIVPALTHADAVARAHAEGVTW